MNKLDKQYTSLLQDILTNGTKKTDRTGTGTISVFGRQIRHKMSEGFPLITTKKMAWKGIVTELLWFLRGDINIKYLVDNGVNIWNEDAYQYYCKIAKGNEDGINSILKPVSIAKNTRMPDTQDIDSYSMFTFDEFVDCIKSSTILKTHYTFKGYTLGDCGYQYGKVWRNWQGYEYKWMDEISPKHWQINETKPIDQIENLINGLKNNPESRRHIVTAIDPAHDTDLALYWCHCMFQFNCRPLTQEQRIEYSLKMNGDTHGMLPSNTPKYYLDCQLFNVLQMFFLGFLLILLHMHC